MHTPMNPKSIAEWNKMPHTDVCDAYAGETWLDEFRCPDPCNETHYKCSGCGIVTDFCELNH